LTEIASDTPGRCVSSQSINVCSTVEVGDNALYKFTFHLLTCTEVELYLF